MQREIDFGGVLVSIHDVSITPDFRHCQVYYGVIGQSRDEKWVAAQIEKHRTSMQAKLAKRVVLKNTPLLHFKIDHSVERGVHTLQLIDDLPPVAEDSEPSSESEDGASKATNPT